MTEIFETENNIKTCSRCHKQNDSDFKLCNLCREKRMKYYYDKQRKTLKGVLKKKVRQYIDQDLKYDRINNITYESILSIIDESKGQCYYCKCSMNMIPAKCYDKQQFTLDRIDNNIGHIVTNVVCSCLHCNLTKKKSTSHI